jgi:hypothetical protein
MVGHGTDKQRLHPFVIRTLGCVAGAVVRGARENADHT